MSVQEAVWHGVPMLGMPLVMDQHRNVQMLCAAGVAEQMDLHDLQADELIFKLEMLLNEER